MRKCIYLTFILCSFGHWKTVAQSYGTAMGLRLGNNKIKRTVGLSMKQRLMKDVTLEGILQSDFKYNSTVHALIQHHRGVLTRRFNVYMGAGFSFGFEESVDKHRYAREIVTTYGNATAGVDLILGLEFTLLKHNFSIDYKPNFNLVGREPWYRGQIGFSARGVLVKGSTQNKRKRQKKRERKRRLKEKQKQEKEGATPPLNFFQKIFNKSTTSPSN